LKLLGSHLPDITVITPIFQEDSIIFFAASLGHHADIDSILPSSMPPQSQNLEEEGACIVAFKLVKNDQFQEQGLTDILMPPGRLHGNSGTRNLRDHMSGLRAQVAANNSCIRLLADLFEEHSFAVVDLCMTSIQENATALFQLGGWKLQSSLPPSQLLGLWNDILQISLSIQFFTASISAYTSGYLASAQEIPHNTTPTWVIGLPEFWAYVKMGGGKNLFLHQGLSHRTKY